MSIDPIRLTKGGDILRVDLEIKIAETDFVTMGIKWHGDLKHPCSPIEVVIISDDHYRLVCRRCGTLLIVHQEVNTYARLREYCRENNKIQTVREIEEKLEQLWKMAKKTSR